jgi:hypothetical protein
MTLQLLGILSDKVTHKMNMDLLKFKKCHAIVMFYITENFNGLGWEEFLQIRNDQILLENICVPRLAV